MLNYRLPATEPWKSHTQHNCKLDDLRTGFEIAKGYWIGHGLDANTQHAVGQGVLLDRARQFILAVPSAVPILISHCYLDEGL